MLLHYNRLHSSLSIICHNPHSSPGILRNQVFYSTMTRVYSRMFCLHLHVLRYYQYLFVDHLWFPTYHSSELIWKYRLEDLLGRTLELFLFWKYLRILTVSNIESRLSILDLLSLLLPLFHPWITFYLFDLSLTIETNSSYLVTFGNIDSYLKVTLFLFIL